MGQFADGINALGMGTANTAIGTGLGLMLEGHNDRRQIKQQQKLTDMQSLANRQQAEYSSQLQYDMWNKTNAPAQVAKYKEAGLNPALMYGGSGAGGTTTGGANAAGVSGASAPSGGNEIIQQQGLAMQQAAQTKLLQKQADGIDLDNRLKEADLPGRTADAEGKGVDSRVKVANEEKQTSAEGWKYDQEIMKGQEANLNWEAMQTAIKGDMGDVNNPLVKAKIAQIKAVHQDYANKVADGTLKQDDHELKNIEKDVNGFTADLAELGINNTTMAVVMKILGGLFGIRMSNKGTTTERVSYDKKGRETSTTTRTTPNKK